MCRLCNSLLLYLHLVGGLEHFLFSTIYGIIILIDFHMFQKKLKPPISTCTIENLLSRHILIGGVEDEFYFPIQLGMIIPTD